MTKEQKDNAIELLFEIYDAGVQNKTVDLTGYLNDLNKALSLHNVVGQSEQYFCEHEEVGYNKRCKEQCSDCNWIENL